MDRCVRIATYNIHQTIGTDRRADVQRISAVIDEIDPDVIVLQEVRNEQFQRLAAHFGHHAVDGPAVMDDAGCYGNLLLSQWPVADHAVVDLAYRSREPRSAIFSAIETPYGPLRVIGSHFGLKHHERMQQARLLADLAAGHRGGPLVIVGDFNDWPPFSRAINLIRREMGLGFGAVPRLPTFPARFPLLALDRIFVRPRQIVRRTWVHDSALTRQASDHRPLVAEIDMPAG